MKKAYLPIAIVLFLLVIAYLIWKDKKDKAEQSNFSGLRVVKPSRRTPYSYNGMGTFRKQQEICIDDGGTWIGIPGHPRGGKCSFAQRA